MSQRSAAEASSTRVLGMLFGRQDGRKVEIYNAKEVNVTVVDGKVLVDKESMAGDTKLRTFI